MITRSVWNRLQYQYGHDPLRVNHNDLIVIRFSKNLVNKAHKAVIALASLVAFVITPILLVLDAPFWLLRKPEMVAETVLNFYNGCRNDKGVTLEEIWEFDDETLEKKHDFIQWLFPLTIRGFNWTAPVTDQEAMSAFKKDEALRKKMRKSFDVMLAFYGFAWETKVSICKGSDFDKKAKNWLTKSNHNFLRITRILKSLKLHGLEMESYAFFKIIEKVYQSHSKTIGTYSFGYWKDAS